MKKTVKKKLAKKKVAKKKGPQPTIERSLAAIMEVSGQLSSLSLRLELLTKTVQELAGLDNPDNDIPF